MVNLFIPIGSTDFFSRGRIATWSRNRLELPVTATGTVLKSPIITADVNTHPVVHVAILYLGILEWWDGNELEIEDRKVFRRA